MPKINQEEYEVLKGLDDRWKWIARDDKNQIYSAEVYVFEKKPEREDGYWNNISNGEYELLREWDALFQFIQWEDEEPYYIAGLIDGFEEAIRINKIFERTTKMASEESEETEVKKDIEWLKDEILTDMRYLEGNRERQQLDIKYQTLREVAQKINSLDEPEVLSQEWLDEHVDYADVRGGTQAFIHVEDLQNLLVPEQGLPVIPKFVAEWYENEGKRSSWWNWFYKWGRDESRSDLETKTIGWMQDYNEEKFVDMFLHGYEVEGEQRYYVMNEENELILGWSQSAYMTPCIEGYEYMKHNGRENLFQLTEQEIKDYDDRYWPFAVKVEEME